MGQLPVFSKVFDNEEFDCRTPTEWLNMGLEPGSQNRKPVPGKALLPTDDNLGHGEQDHPGVAERSCPRNPWPRPLGSLVARRAEVSVEIPQLGRSPRIWPQRGRGCKQQRQHCQEGWEPNSQVLFREAREMAPR